MIGAVSALPGLPGSIPGQTVPVNYTILSDSCSSSRTLDLGPARRVAIGLLGYAWRRRSACAAAFSCFLGTRHSAIQ